MEHPWARNIYKRVGENVFTQVDSNRTSGNVLK